MQIIIRPGIYHYGGPSILRPPMGPKMWSYIAGGLKIKVI